MAELDDTPDRAWAVRQRLAALIGAVFAVAGLVGGIIGAASYPRADTDQHPFAVLAVVGSALLACCCLINLAAWSVAVGHWRDGGIDTGRWWRLSLAAHAVSYPALLLGMYGMIAASALAGWSSPPGVFFGISFIVIIFAQIIGGTQRLRRAGPPGTIPTYFRQLSAKVQSMR